MRVFDTMEEEEEASSHLPDFFADPQGVDKLLEVTFSEVQSLAPSLCAVMLQPEISTAAITPLGFITVHNCRHFSSGCVRKHPCSAEAKAVISIQVGCRVTDEGMDCVETMSTNADAAMIIVLLIVPELATGCTAAAPSERSTRSMARVQSRVRQINARLLKAGADDVIIHAGDRPLQLQRLWSTMDTVLIRAGEFCQVMESTSEVATKMKGEFEEVARQKMHLAWKKQIWHLPGNTFVNLPKVAKHVTELPSDDAGWVGSIGRYRLTKRLGQGAFGTVYAAQHPDKGSVAIKSIMKGLVQDIGGLYSIDQEVGVMRHLEKHPNIVEFVDVIHTAECIHVVMTYGGPENLHQWSIRKVADFGSLALPLDLAIEFGGQLASSLAHIHAKRVCHRDLKPENVIVSGDEQKVNLTDFGLAALVYGKNQRIANFCGSLPFCAPEVLQLEVKGSSGDYEPLAADSWSLGACFAELLWGPCGLEKHLGWVPHPPRANECRLHGIRSLAAMWEGAPDQGLCAIVKNLLVLNPEDRWGLQTVVENKVFGLVPPCIIPDAATIDALVLPNVGWNVASNIIKIRSLSSSGSSRYESCESDICDLTLMEQVGGKDAIRDAVVAMLDKAIPASPVQSVVDRRPADIPKLRELYVDVVACVFEFGVESVNVRQEFKRMRKEHKVWEFSNRDFDAMSEMFDAVLKKSGTNEGVIEQASFLFKHMREPATDAYHEKTMLARGMNTPEWRRCMLGSPKGVARIKKFALALRELVANKSRRVPQSWCDPDVIEEHLRKFLGGDPATLTPLPLDNTIESDDELLLPCVQAALRKAGFASKDAAVPLAVFRGSALECLNRELSKLRAKEMVVAANKICWMGKILEVSSSLARYPPTRSLSKRAAFAAYLGHLGEMVESERSESLQDLAVKSEKLGIGPDHFNDVLLSLRIAGADLPLVLLEQLLVVVQTMRSWAMVLAQHGDLATLRMDTGAVGPRGCVHENFNWKR